jgi:hypothetical protein
MFIRCITVICAAALAGCGTGNQPVVVSLPTPISLAAFSGAGSGIPPTAADVNALSPQLETLDLAISGNTISAPVIVPLLPVTFNGVIALESGERGPPIGGVNPPEVFVIGNLTIVADLGAGTATSNASDFAEFVAVSNGVLASSTAIWGGFTGSLSGSGTASLSTINTSLSGTLATGNRGALPVNLNIAGNIYDDNGTLLVRGITDDGPDDFFIASE